MCEGGGRAGRAGLQGGCADAPGGDAHTEAWRMRYRERAAWRDGMTAVELKQPRSPGRTGTRGGAPSKAGAAG